MKGSVAWLRGKGGRAFETLRVDVGPRVADVELADFNGDGTLDVAVSAFGWRKVGNLTVLENHTTDYTKPSFVARVIDPRPGAIQAIPTDLNKDGRLDLIALFAQQFETVVAFINTGASEIAFTPQALYTAPHPNWGSSGIQLADLDTDGDPDVLLTHATPSTTTSSSRITGCSGWRIAATTSLSSTASPTCPAPAAPTRSTLTVTAISTSWQPP